MSLQALPNELFLEIVKYLGLKDRHSLLFTDRRHSQIISGDILNFAIVWGAYSLNKLQTDILHRHKKDVTAAGCAYALTALHIGSIHGNRNTVEFILEKTASIKVTAANGEILQAPISKGKLSSTSEFLLEAGGASNVHCGDCGTTALHCAAERGHEVMVKRLLDHGVLDSPDHRGHRAIHRAAAMGHEDIVRQLVSNGSSEKDCTHSGNTALHHAAYNDRLGVVKVLLDEFRWDINLRGFRSQTALHIAADLRNMKLAKLLLQRGADDTFQDSSFLLAAEVAYDTHDDSDTRSAKMVALIESFAINKQCPEGETPLHRAVRYANLVMVRWLLNSGAKIDVQDKRGYTPLHLAAEFSEELTFELLKRGADDSLRNREGLRAIDIARSYSDSIYGTFLGLGHE